MGQSITTGFALALCVWTAWFITHLPWTGLSPQVQLASVLAVWLVAAVTLSSTATWRSAIGAGLVSAILGLLLLGSKLVEPAAANQAGSVKPNALLIAVGFIALGGFQGLAGFLISRLIPKKPTDANPDWLARFAVVTAYIVAVLLFIGGLVTSTHSGMAVPDWPRTYGANMFLYPLSGAAADIFLEHSHRLFGTLVGLSTITLLIWTFATERRGWVKILAAVILALVITQGVIGGFRVNANSRVVAMLHGVLGQLTFGLIVAMAAILSPTFKRKPDRCDCGYPLDSIPAVESLKTCPECGAVREISSDAPLLNPRRLRAFTTGFLHATILQLVFGAMSRHFPTSKHSLYSHMAFSVVVVLLAVMAGFSARAVTGRHGGIGPILRRFGAWAVGVIAVQFILGWVAFLARGEAKPAAGVAARAEAASEALIRTAHQANGALVLALAILGFVWTRRLLRGLKP